MRRPILLGHEPIQWHIFEPPPLDWTAVNLLATVKLEENRTHLIAKSIIDSEFHFHFQYLFVTNWIDFSNIGLNYVKELRTDTNYKKIIQVLVKQLNKLAEIEETSW